MIAESAIKRPIVRYFGGKWRIAPWIISKFPPHRVYTEAFGGGASVLLRKTPSWAEVYNDLDGEIVNLFRVCRDHGPDLVRLLTLTPFSHDEFDGAYEQTGEPVEWARRTLIRSHMGHGADAASGKWRTGFRCSTIHRRSTTPAGDWSGLPDVAVSVCKRLKRVIIENRDAVEVLLGNDGPDTLHYVDPPYVHQTRGDGRTTPHGYRQEMTDSQHEALAEVLYSLTGHVVLSGYDCDLYRQLFGSWIRVEHEARADGGKKRTEVLWIKGPARAGRLL
jgi:DNA adenine methylase